MKLSKSVLAGSLATAGIVLGAIAPAVTAQAATGTGATAADGTVTYDKGTDGKGVDVGPLGGENSKLAIAYDSADGKGDGQASAESNANVTVQSGLLTLDAVPDFGFANAAEGTTVALDNNDKNGSTAADSEGQGKLTVTESRADQPGFTVDASLTKFAPVGVTATDANSKAYTLVLNKTELKDDQGNNVSPTGIAQTEDANIVAGDTNGGQVINLAKGTYNKGAINASFTKDDEDAFLNLNDTGTAAKAGTTSYNATITWTLKTLPVSNPQG